MGTLTALSVAVQSFREVKCCFTFGFALTLLKFYKEIFYVFTGKIRHATSTVT